MNISHYKQWSEKYLENSRRWKNYTQLTYRYLQEYFHGALSSFEIDDVHNTFSFILFGHDCTIRYWTNIDRFYFEYEVCNTRGKRVIEIVEMDRLLRFELPTGRIEIRETDSEFAKESFFSLMETLVAEIRKGKNDSTNT